MWVSRWLLIRDVLLFFVGFLGMMHETMLFSGLERPTLLLIFAAMMGLPILFRMDERR